MSDDYSEFKPVPGFAFPPRGILDAIRAHGDPTSRANALGDAEAYIAKLRGILLHYWGTTDPELLAEVWADRIATPPGAPSSAGDATE
jgi:hypothetical protein